MSKKLNRRAFLRHAATSAAAAAVLSGCAAPTATPTTPPKPAAAQAATAAPNPTATQAATAMPKATGTLASAATGCKMDWNPSLPPVPKKYSPPVVVYSPYNQTPQWRPGDSIYNNPLYNRLVDNMGIQFKSKWEAGIGIDQQRLDAAIAANDLPDSFSVGGAMRDKLIADGALANIKDIWEATVSPLVKDKKHYPKHPWWLPVLVNGGVWGIPFTYGPGYTQDNAGLIRQDWLDKVSMPIPKTLDELDKTMRAFKKAGLGQFGINCNADLVTWHSSLDPIFGAFGVMPKAWQKNDSGKLQWGSTFSNVKKGLDVLRTWYKDGLIDPDYYTRSYADNQAILYASKCGITFSPWWYIRQAILQAEAQNPGAKFAPDGVTHGAGRQARPPRYRHHGSARGVQEGNRADQGRGRHQPAQLEHGYPRQL